MNCKHAIVQGNTKKYYYCMAKNKVIDEYECRDCMIRLPDLPTRI